MRVPATFAVLTLALAGSACTQSETPTTTTATPATATAPVATPPPMVATHMPPAATTPASPATVAAPGGAMPADGAIAFAGFGPAHWGASDEQVRQAWGKDMEGKADEPGGCYYLFPAPRQADGYRVGFMMEGDKFGRIDVRTSDIAAPGGGKVGMDKAALHRLYPGMTEQANKYDANAKNLRIVDPQGGPGVLIIETDPAGKATQWHVGVPPMVDYVEGCS